MDDEFEKATRPVEEEPSGRADLYDSEIHPEGRPRPEHILSDPDDNDVYRVYARNDPLDEDELVRNNAGVWYPPQEVFDAVVGVYQDVKALGGEYGRTYNAEGAMGLANGYDGLGHPKTTSEVVRPEDAETLLACGYRPLKSNFRIFSADEQVDIQITLDPGEADEEDTLRAGARLEDASLDELVAVRDVLWEHVGEL